MLSRFAVLSVSLTPKASPFQTYSGDASHHLFLANNVYRQAYGNDRETMTYDDFGSAYYGGFTDLQMQGDTAILRTPGGNRSEIGGKKQVRFLTEILDDFRRFVDEFWRF